MRLRLFRRLVELAILHIPETVGVRDPVSLRKGYLSELRLHEQSGLCDATAGPDLLRSGLMGRSVAYMIGSDADLHNQFWSQ